MSKVDIDLVIDVLRKTQIEKDTTRNIVEEIKRQSAAVAAAEKEAAEPKLKKQYVFLVSDPDGKLDAIEGLTGWIVQIPDEDPPMVAAERIIKGAVDFNLSKKGRKLPVETIGDACEAVPAKFFKEHNVWLKNKQPCYVFPIENDIPGLDNDMKNRRAEDRNERRDQK